MSTVLSSGDRWLSVQAHVIQLLLSNRCMHSDPASMDQSEMANVSVKDFASLQGKH